MLTPCRRRSCTHSHARPPPLTCVRGQVLPFHTAFRAHFVFVERPVFLTGNGSHTPANHGGHNSSHNDTDNAPSSPRALQAEPAPPSQPPPPPLRLPHQPHHPQQPNETGKTNYPLQYVLFIHTDERQQGTQRTHTHTLTHTHHRTLPQLNTARAHAGANPPTFL